MEWIFGAFKLKMCMSSKTFIALDILGALFKCASQEPRLQSLFEPSVTGSSSGSGVC